MEQPQLRPARRQREDRQPGGDRDRAAQQRRRDHQQRARGGLLRAAQAQRRGQAGERDHEDEVPPALQGQPVRVRPYRPDGDDAARRRVRQDRSQGRARDAARPLGQAVPAHAGHQVAGAQPRPRPGDVHHHAGGPPAQPDDGPVRGRVQGRRRRHHAQHHQGDRHRRRARARSP
ncbi:hypothetical protein MF672_021185 [Actinomadura sp. ATCC 31491]|uniref:Uncharacterized protein n=1 Tax=Actinomadura luzonensis TaxID=2805427 RepID=A0ABT0FVD7_9ACTN|nr:hypothetical protein [Actinomadura luzonensis]MCK2216296.1 hypothetical protein [Actinomadura luzonensis]